MPIADRLLIFCFTNGERKLKKEQIYRDKERMMEKTCCNYDERKRNGEEEEEKQRARASRKRN